MSKDGVTKLLFGSRPLVLGVGADAIYTFETPGDSVAQDATERANSTEKRRYVSVVLINC
jgi:hypothetical protein